MELCPLLQGWRFFTRPGERRLPSEFWGLRRDALTEALPTPEMARVEEEWARGPDPDSYRVDAGRDDAEAPHPELIRMLYAGMGQGCNFGCEGLVVHLQSCQEEGRIRGQSPCSCQLSCYRCGLSC